MVAPSGSIQIALALGLAPLMLGIINRTKAVLAGRRGPPLVQTYRELWKLLRKSAVYSHSTTPVFVAGPLAACAATAMALALVPLNGSPSLIAFPGDFLLVAYLLGLARFFTMSAALDTASAFEGMGASREAFFSALAEPALLVALTTLAAICHGTALSDVYAAIQPELLTSPAGPALFLIAAAMFVVFLAENARIPVDDPNTHLELTMIHEVMVLDHSGPDFALIQYAASLKMWLLGCLLVGVAAPWRSGWVLLDLVVGLLGLTLLAMLVGVVESVSARLRLVRVPQFLIAASILSIVALVLVLR